LDIVINGAAGALTRIDTGRVACARTQTHTHRHTHTHTALRHLLFDETPSDTDIRRVHTVHTAAMHCLFYGG